MSTGVTNSPYPEPSFALPELSTPPRSWSISWFSFCISTHYLTAFFSRKRPSSCLVEHSSCVSLSISKPDLSGRNIRRDVVLTLARDATSQLSGLALWRQIRTVGANAKIENRKSPEPQNYSRKPIPIYLTHIIGKPNLIDIHLLDVHLPDIRLPGVHPQRHTS
jgi:hypothetical protein